MSKSRFKNPIIGKCLFCGKPLSLAVGVVRGVGPGCFHIISSRLGVSWEYLSELPEEEFTQAIQQAKEVDTRPHFQNLEEAIQAKGDLISVKELALECVKEGIPVGWCLEAIGGNTGTSEPISDMWKQCVVKGMRYVSKECMGEVGSLGELLGKKSRKKENQ